jgi:hypothetical protein
MRKQTNIRSLAPLLDFSYGKRHRGGARDDSNLIVDRIELTDLFIGSLFAKDLPKPLET